MNAADIVAALDLPPGVRVDQRVPKKLLVENGAPTASDKRKINEGVEDVHWLAALKPTTIGVPEFRDPTREYLEIAVISAVLRPGADANRLAELVHRAVPYPVFLITTQANSTTMSLAQKRRSQGETGATVLDGALVTANLEDGRFEKKFGEALSIARQPRGDLFTLYQGWLDTLLALLAARVTGAFAAAESPVHAAARRNALTECVRLEIEIAALRTAASKESQLPRRVAMNQTLKRLQDEHAAVRANL